MERAVDKNRSVRIETYAEKQIEITARKLARRYNLPATETEEIADAFRNVVERRFLATYDETKSSLPTYLSAFLSRQTPNVLRRVFDEVVFYAAGGLQNRNDSARRVGIFHLQKSGNVFALLNGVFDCRGVQRQHHFHTAVRFQRVASRIG